MSGNKKEKRNKKLKMKIEEKDYKKRIKMKIKMKYYIIRKLKNPTLKMRIT